MSLTMEGSRKGTAMKTRTRARRSKPAIGYVRRSTDRQEQSLSDQQKAIEAYAAQAGFEILDWYADDAISGAGADDRQAFLRMIHDAQQSSCPFQYILVYDVKRFGRLDNDETGHYRYLLRKAGVEVIYVAENFSGDDTDDLLLPVKQWQARQELRDLSKVTIRGLLSKVDGGWWMGGIPPYGYDLVYFNGSGEFLMIVRYMPDGSKQVLDENGELQRTLRRGDKLRVSKQDRARLVPSDPVRVAVVQEIFRLYVREGLGFRTVAARLNEKGVPSPRNGQWSRMHSEHWAMTSIRDILMNPAYAGDAVWNRRSFAKFSAGRRPWRRPRCGNESSTGMIRKTGSSRAMPIRLSSRAACSTKLRGCGSRGGDDPPRPTEAAAAPSRTTCCLASSSVTVAGIDGRGTGPTVGRRGRMARGASTNTTPAAAT